MNKTRWTKTNSLKFPIFVSKQIKIPKINQMKKIFLILFAAGILLNAQDKLIVEYESFTKMEMDNITTFSDSNIADKEWQDALKIAMETPSYYQLIMTSDESVYEYQERINNQQKDEGSRVYISLGQRGKLYKNLKENLVLREANSWNVDYLIQDSVKTYDWKITRESQEILGYEVRKATAEVDSTTNLVAWYAPRLSFKSGPDVYGGLPGLILKLERISKTKSGGEQTQTTTAISIQTGNEKTKITRPKKGKLVNQKEFKEENEKQMQKMKEMYDGGIDKD